MFGAYARKFAPKGLSGVPSSKDEYGRKRSKSVTRAEARVTVAKDVLKQTRAGRQSRTGEK